MKTRRNRIDLARQTLRQALLVWAKMRKPAHSSASAGTDVKESGSIGRQEPDAPVETHMGQLRCHLAIGATKPAQGQSPSGQRMVGGMYFWVKRTSAAIIRISPRWMMSWADTLSRHHLVWTHQKSDFLPTFQTGKECGRGETRQAPPTPDLETSSPHQPRSGAAHSSRPAANMKCCRPTRETRLWAARSLCNG